MTGYDKAQAAMAAARKDRTAREHDALVAWTKADGPDAKREAWESYLAVCREATEEMVERLDEAHAGWLAAKDEAARLKEEQRAAKAREREAAKAEAGADATESKPKRQRKAKTAEV